jgi:glycosyltransferase involved in cell wall biosynthesis
MSLRTLLVSNAFWTGTGYGTQSRQLAVRLRNAGHEVALFANYGLQGSRIESDGFRVYPSALEGYGNDLIHGHADDWNADLVIILFDAFAMNGMILRRMPQHVCIWQPVDCEPLGRMDKEQFRMSGAQPIAMAKFGQRMLADEGLDPFYAPHGIDTEGVFKPPERILYDEFGETHSRESARRSLREADDVPEDAFIIGMNVHNKDTDRKAVFEQMSAFALFRSRHADALLLCHTMPHPAMSGNDLIGMADFLGIGPYVRWADPYSLLAGNYTQADMAKWYSKLHVYTGASRGEGFGLPILEAQACGVPVIVTDCSAMTELVGPGWLVGGQPYWQKGHAATWITPDIGELLDAYEDAYNGEADKRSDRARAFADNYNDDLVYDRNWAPIMASLEARLTEEPPRPERDEGWRLVR